ncbi:site-specific integrase [Nonomuraea rosea]|uniref:Site-specific integrase n=1 Tax=Nonomuraea rosea TaxID=638574 RepID=A0ABP6WIV1_9ACTN
MARRKSRRQHGEGSIYQRKKDGRWVCELHLGYKPDGRPDRRYLYGDTSDEVIEKRRKFWQAQDDGFTPAKGRGRTVGEWLAHWLSNIVKAQVRESTWHKSYRPKVENYLIPGLNRILLKELDEDRVEKLYARLKADGLAPATILQIHAILSRALKIAAKRKLIPRNPCSFVAPARGDRAEIVPPERNEAAAILQAVATRWNGARWALALSVGPRQGEALGLTWPMLDLSDLDHATIRIAWELARVPWQHGCEDPKMCGDRLHKRPCPPDPADCPKVRPTGRRHVCQRPCPSRCSEHQAGQCPTWCPDDCVKHASTCKQRIGGGLVLTEPKSAKSKRTAALPRRMAELLNAHQTWQEAQRVGNPAWVGWGHDSQTCDRRPRARETVCPKCRKPTKRDALVFTQSNGTPIDGRRDWQEWTDLLAELGLPHYRPHDSRHFAATTALEEDVDVVVVQEMLGHATSAFTQSTYQHVRPKLQRQAADKIGGALWGSDT